MPTLTMSTRPLSPAESWSVESVRTTASTVLSDAAGSANGTVARLP